MIFPRPEPMVTLDQLLAGITDEYLHDEIETGAPVGKEIWQVPTSPINETPSA